jgi:hypothetical protein
MYILKKSQISTIISALLCFIVAAFLLLITKSEIFYFGFVVAALLSYLIWHLLSDTEQNLVTEHEPNINFKQIIDLLLIAIVIVLIITNASGLLNAYLKTVFSLLVVCYLPGWALLRLTRFFGLASKSQVLLLPFIISLPVSCLLFSVFIKVNNPSNFLLIFYFILSILPLLKNKLKFTFVGFHFFNRQSHSSWIYIAIFGLLISFFIVSLFSIYPQISLVPGLDIVEHYSAARQLVLSPAAYTGDELWFHIQEALVYLFSSASIDVFQTTTALLSIFSIIAFYLMSKTYLRDIDNRLPIIATVFWALLSGFGWLYFFNSTSGVLQSNFYSILSEASNRTYFDTGFGQGLIWFWYRPITLGLTILFSLLYLLRETRLSKKVFIPIFMSLIISLTFVHFPEAVFLSLFLMLICIVRPASDLRLHDAAISCSLGFILGILLLNIYNYYELTISAPSTYQLLILLAISLVSILPLRIKRSHSFNLRNISVYLAFIGAIIYIWLLLIAPISIKSFSISSVEPSYSVPWEFYPLLLGIGGLLSLPAVVLVARHHFKHPVVIFVGLLFFSIIFGRFLSLINIDFYTTGYWERRIVPITYACVALLAPIALFEFAKLLKRPSKRIILPIFVAFIIVSGFASTLLSLQFQNYVSTSNALSQSDQQTINELNNLMPDKVLLTVTDSSLALSRFSPSSWPINYYRYQLWSALSPELPLNVLVSQNSQVCVLLKTDDQKEINNKYSSGYLSSEILPILNFTNSVAALPSFSAVSSNSKTFLVLPDSYDKSLWTAYNLLSGAGYNYSTVSISDISLLSNAKTLIAPDEEIAQQIIAYKSSFNMSFENLLVLNLNGYGPIANNFFSFPKTSVSIDPNSNNNAKIQFNGYEDNNSIANDSISTDLTVVAKYSDLDFTALSDGTTSDWVPSAIGSGSIDVPSISSASHVDTQTNPLQITVGQGQFAYWQIAKTYSVPVNSNQSDFLSFKWFGHNDMKTYVIQIWSDSKNNYWYRFKDEWTGWKQIEIPLNSPAGLSEENGVEIAKVINGSPSWTSISRIEIRNEGSNPNRAGQFLIADLGFTSAKKIGITIQGENTKGFSISNYNGTAWVDLGSFDEKTVNFQSNYSFLNGNTSSMLGDYAHLYGNMSQNSGMTKTLHITLAIPSESLSQSMSSIRLHLVSNTVETSSDMIIGQKNEKITVNNSLVLPLLTSLEVNSNYESAMGHIPLVVKNISYDFNYYYINYYPLENTNHDNFGLLGNIFNMSGLANLIDYATPKAENPVQGNLATFTNIKSTGNTELKVKSSSIVISHNGTMDISNDQIMFHGVTKAIFDNPALILTMSNCEIDGDYGFYTRISSDQVNIQSKEDIVGTALIEFENDTQQVVDFSSATLKIVGLNYCVVREPVVEIKGTVAFDNLYAYATLSQTLRAVNDNGKLSGVLRFNVLFGDVFTVTNGFVFSGNFEPSNQPYKYDEVSILLQNIPFLILLSFFCLVLLLSKKIAFDKNEG